MEETKPQSMKRPPAEPIEHVDHAFGTELRTQSMASLSIREVRRQLGWFLTPDNREFDH
jgi:hypothetical protein